MARRDAARPDAAVPLREASRHPNASAHHRPDGRYSGRLADAPMTSPRTFARVSPSTNAGR